MEAPAPGAPPPECRPAGRIRVALPDGGPRAAQILGGHDRHQTLDDETARRCNHQESHHRVRASIPVAPRTRLKRSARAAPARKRRPRSGCGRHAEEIQGAVPALPRGSLRGRGSITTANVAGPLRPGMASGVKAMVVLDLRRARRPRSPRGSAREQHAEAVEATITPPAMRMPGIEMPKKFMTRLPATRNPVISAKGVDAGAGGSAAVVRPRAGWDATVITIGTAPSGLDDGQDRQHGARRVAEIVGQPVHVRTLPAARIAAWPPRAGTPRLRLTVLLLAGVVALVAVSERTRRQRAWRALAAAGRARLRGLGCAGPGLELGLHRRLQGCPARAPRAIRRAAPSSVRAVLARRAGHGLATRSLAITRRCSWCSRRSTCSPRARRTASCGFEHGADFARYADEVRAFVPRWSAYEVPDTLEVRPRILWKAFLDAVRCWACGCCCWQRTACSAPGARPRGSRCRERAGGDAAQA